MSTWIVTGAGLQAMSYRETSRKTFMQDSTNMLKVPDRQSATSTTSLRSLIRSCRAGVLFRGAIEDLWHHSGSTIPGLDNSWARHATCTCNSLGTFRPRCVLVRIHNQGASTNFRLSAVLLRLDRRRSVLRSKRLSHRKAALARAIGHLGDSRRTLPVPSRHAHLALLFCVRSCMHGFLCEQQNL